MAISRLCSIPDCGKPYRAKGLCNTHYELNRLRTKRGKNKKRGEVQKFYLETVLGYEGEECLLWPYNRSVKGYAVMMANGKCVRVSRHLCIEVNGPPPTDSHHAAHNCGRGKDGCVTKSHLQWKTPAENEADKLIHGTGHALFLPKINETTAREIMDLKGLETQKVIAERYDISVSSVAMIHQRKSWKNI